jgi:hypothetical protein
MAQICDKMLVPCNQLVHMAIAEDDYTILKPLLLVLLSLQSITEYSKIHQYSQTSTNWDDDQIPWPK